MFDVRAADGLPQSDRRTRMPPVSCPEWIVVRRQGCAPEKQGKHLRMKCGDSGTSPAAGKKNGRADALYGIGPSGRGLPDVSGLFSGYYRPSFSRAASIRRNVSSFPMISQMSKMLGPELAPTSVRRKEFIT